MYKKVKIGLVGCGDVSRKWYLPGIAYAKEIDLISVCDVVEERAKKAKEDFSAKEYYLDYSEMLQKADIEAVVNITKPKYHFPLNLEALKAGKHVYTEKTMALTLEEADILIKQADEMGLKLVAAPPVMLAPVNKEIKKIIEKGLIGKVCFVCANSSHSGAASFDDFTPHPYTTDPTWLYKQGGGPLVDMGVYALHTLTGILGPAKRVTAFSGISIPEVIARSGVVKGKKIKVEVDDNTQLLLDFGENTFAYLNATYCMKAYKGPDISFYGSEGTVVAAKRARRDFQVYTEKEEVLGMRGWITPLEDKNPNWTIAKGVLHLAECIREDKKPVISAEHARHVIEIIIMAYESAKSGQAKNLTTTF